MKFAPYQAKRYTVCERQGPLQNSELQAVAFALLLTCSAISAKVVETLDDKPPARQKPEALPTVLLIRIHNATTQPFDSVGGVCPTNHFVHLRKSLPTLINAPAPPSSLISLTRISVCWTRCSMAAEEDLPSETFVVNFVSKSRMRVEHYLK